MKSNFYYNNQKNKEKKETDYGICPQPTSAQDALNELKDYFLGEDWIVWFPLGVEQVNTCIIEEIKDRYKGIKPKKSFKEKLYKLIDKINKL